MYYTGIDLHKLTSYLTTVYSSGKIVKQQNMKNVDNNFIQYFHSMPGSHKTTVESTMTWYWLKDLLTTLNIPLVLAHAKLACRQAGMLKLLHMPTLKLIK